MFHASQIINPRLLAEYVTEPLLFGDMVQCTTTVCVVFAGVTFKEEELTPRLHVDTAVHPNIVGFESNFGVWPPKVTPVTNGTRGRRPKAKAARKGKVKGTGECFNSQILFRVAGTYVRRKPIMADKHVGIPVDMEHERITTLYKIKVFQNGKVTIPGVLDFAMRDIEEPLADLQRYLREYMPEATVQRKYPVMVNFKFLLLRDVISLPILEAFVRASIRDFIGVNVGHFYAVCINPYPVGTEAGWREAILAKVPPKSYEAALAELKSCALPHNICASPESLQCGYEALMLPRLHSYMANLVRYADFGNVFLKYCAEAFMQQQLALTERNLAHSNILLSPSSDEERQFALLIHLRTPNVNDPDRVTKIKIFPSPTEHQKIAIDGANDLAEGEYIYWWFNKFLADSGAIYTPYHYPSDDDEFPL